MSGLLEPNEPVAPVGIGIAGLGRSGMFHVERLGLRDDCRILAASEPDLSTRERARGLSFPIDLTWRDMLDHAAIDLILIATPPASHSELALDALRAGKHVILDPPMCLTRTEAGKLTDAARESRRMLSVAHLHRWDDDFLTAQAAVASGALGRLNVIRKIVWQFNPPLARHRPEWATAEQRVAGGIEGAALWEFGTHDFDQLLLLASEQPASVFATLSDDGPKRRGAESFLALITFPSGLVAHVEFNRAALAPVTTGWMISGATGAYANFTQYSATDEGEVVDVPLTPVTIPLDQFYAAAVGHVRRGLPVPCPAEDLREVIALVEAVQQSTQTGEVALVDR